MPLAAIGIAASVIGAFYYIKIVKVMYFDEPARGRSADERQAHRALLALGAIVVSPLGYLLTVWLGGLADRRGSGAVLPCRALDPQSFAETGSTNADLAGALPAGERPEGDWLVADRQTAGRGRQGASGLDAPGNFMGSTVVHLRAGDPPPADAGARRRPGGVRGGRALSAARASCSSSGPTTCCSAAAKLAGILLERERR